MAALTTVPASIAAPGTPNPTSLSGILFDTGSSTLVASTSSSPQQTSNAASPSATPSQASNSGGLPLSTELVAIIVPIAVVVILIPIIYMLWVRHRSRKNRIAKLKRTPPDTPPQETRLLRHSPQNSAFLPSPLNDGERIKSGSLGVFELRRSLEDQGKMDSIGVFDQNARETRHVSSPPQRGPSPTLPSPKVPAFNRPPSESWPLPAGGLNLPLANTSAPQNPYANTNRSLPRPPPAVAPNSAPLASPPLPSPPYHQHPALANARDHNPDILSFASSDVLVAPGASFRPPSSNYDLTPSSTTFPESARMPPTQSSSRTEPTTSVARTRDSDLVSELSYHEPSDRDMKRDTDAVSMVSALTDKRRRSERDADAISLVSVLSPEEPPIPMEHYPL